MDSILESAKAIPARIHWAARQLVGRLSDVVLRVYRDARHGVEWLLYDRRQPVDTGRHVSLEDLGLEDPDLEAYQPTRWNALRSLIPKSDVKPTDVFVDFGSGMGRVIQQAAGYPFARVVGVEISDELNEIAGRNFEPNRARFACQRAEFVTCDATEFQVPDEMTYAYMFNPFTGEAFHKVLGNIIASIERRPRRVILIYHNPSMRQAVEDSGRFRLLEERKTTRTMTTCIYESTP